MKKTITRVSVRDIAQAAGVSKSTVGYVLRNQAGPSEKTRQQVLRAARRLGYVPDARINSWMARVRGAKSKELLSIAWLNTQKESDCWQKYKYLSPYLEGARERGLELGYRLEEIWMRQPGMTMRRISQILRQRGIEGVIVTHPARHIRLDWDHLAGVAIESDFTAPHLHRVMADLSFNILLALKSLKRLGYRRIGLCFSDKADQIVHYLTPAILNYSHSTISKFEQIPPLFYFPENTENSSVVRQQIAVWLKRYKPDVVVGHSSHILAWVEAAGYHVPKDMGVAHIATDDDVGDWAGINSNRRAIGAIAAEMVISFIHNRQFGIPKIASHTDVRGAWHPGRTVAIPKEKH